MRWQSSVANKLPALEWVRAPKRASVPVSALFFAALLSTVPINAQKIALKFGSLGSGPGHLKALLGIPIGVDSVRAACTNDNRIKKLLPGNQDPIVRPAIGFSGSRESQSVLPMPAFASRQVDQICSYRFKLF